MGIFHIQLTADAKTFVKEGKDSAIVVAQSAAEAKLIMKAFMGLPSDEAWAAATVTEITEGVDLEYWRARISIYDTVGALVESVTVTADSGDDFDAIGDDLVIALNATDSIAGAAYATPALTIAETTDTLGDHTVVVEFLPPTTWNDPTIALPSFYSALVHENAGGAALTVALNDVVLPAVKYEVGSGH
jgi:hypothetical protein